MHNLTALDRFRNPNRLLPVDYPATLRFLYVPDDDVRGALLYLLGLVRHSLTIGMFAFTDPNLGDPVRALCANPAVKVTLSLDSSEQVSPHEQWLLNREQFPNTSVSFGTSQKGQYMHLKDMVVDREIVVSGSTNWTTSGELDEDNVLVVVLNRHVAAEHEDMLLAVHAWQLAHPLPAPVPPPIPSPTPVPANLRKRRVTTRRLG